MPKQTFTDRFKTYQDNIQYIKPLLDELSNQLGVSTDSMFTLGIGYIPIERAWVFPERNETGKIIGLMRRFSNGKKMVISGSKRGLYYEEQTILSRDNRYSRGKDNWIGTTREIPCPLCRKIGECLLSADNPQSPGAVLCAHVSEGATQTRSTGYLHIFNNNQMENPKSNLLSLYYSLGLSRLVRGEFIKAELAYRKAMELAYDPINCYIFLFHAQSLSVGYFDRAIEIIETARQIDPLNQTIYALHILTSALLGDVQRAEEKYDHGRALFGDHWTGG